MLGIALLGIASLPTSLVRHLSGAACLIAMLVLTVNVNFDAAMKIDGVGAWVPQQPKDDSLESLIKITSNKNVHKELFPYLCLRQHLAGREVLLPAKARLNSLAIKAISRAHVRVANIQMPPKPTGPVISCGEFKITPDAETDRPYTYNYEQKLFVTSSNISYE